MSPEKIERNVEALVKDSTSLWNNDTVSSQPLREFNDEWSEERVPHSIPPRSAESSTSNVSDTTAKPLETKNIDKSLNFKTPWEDKESIDNDWAYQEYFDNALTV